VRYWTVLDAELVVGEADAFLRHVRFGRDGSELTTRSYAGGIALYLRWCERTGRDWVGGVEDLGLFITWLRHAGASASGVERVQGRGEVLAGPGPEPVRGARRVNGVLAAVRGLVVHAVTAGRAPGRLLPLVYELADDRDLPVAARGEGGRLAWRMRALRCGGRRRVGRHPRPSSDRRRHARAGERPDAPSMPTGTPDGR
jgi:integrase/recombinase XerD